MYNVRDLLKLTKGNGIRGPQQLPGKSKKGSSFEKERVGPAYGFPEI